MIKFFLITKNLRASSRKLTNLGPLLWDWLLHTVVDWCKSILSRRATLYYHDLFSLKGLLYCPNLVSLEGQLSTGSRIYSLQILTIESSLVKYRLLTSLRLNYETRVSGKIMNYDRHTCMNTYMNTCIHTLCRFWNTPPSRFLPVTEERLK